MKNRERGRSGTLRPGVILPSVRFNLRELALVGQQ